MPGVTSGPRRGPPWRGEEVWGVEESEGGWGESSLGARREARAGNGEGGCV